MPFGGPSFQQVAYRLRNDDGSETAATWIAAKNTDASVAQDVSFRCRFHIYATSGWGAKTFNLYYSLNGAAYAAVTDSTPVQFAASSHFDDGDDCTAQIGVTNFLADNNGMKEAAGGVANTGAFQIDQFETEWCLLIDSEQTEVGDTIALRIYDGTSAIAAYSATPLITVDEPAPPASTGSVSSLINGGLVR